MAMSTLFRNQSSAISFIYLNKANTFSLFLPFDFVIYGLVAVLLATMHDDNICQIFRVLHYLKWDERAHANERRKKNAGPVQVGVEEFL